MDTDPISTVKVSVDGHGDPLYTVDLSDVTTSTTAPAVLISDLTWLNSNVAAPTITLDDSIWTGVSTQPSATISLRGDDADIDINGVSLRDTLQGIQDRLNILCPDPEMEAEWDELREIREQYEAKLAECREKSRAWRALQQHG